jgi:TonB family protein
MKIPVSLYHAIASSGPGDTSPLFLGDFAYADGGFRYVDWQLMQALSTAPPLRVRIGGSVQAPKLLNRVAPVYPQEARAKHIEGTVKLHVILAKDGTVRQVGLLSGDPMLAQAAANAVWQWKYQPTLLNGQPIEVDTEVTVVFQLGN